MARRDNGGGFENTMNYIICTTPRARSSVLMRYLKQLGAGYADAWLNPWFDALRDADNPEAHYTFIKSRETDGHCGIRVTWGALSNFCKKNNIKTKAFFDTILPDAKFIYFTRDVLRQVVEAVFYESVNMFDDPLTTVPIQNIHSMLKEYAIAMTAWELFFEKYDIQPCRIQCEDLIDNKESTCKHVMESLGIPYPSDITLRDRTRDALYQNKEVDKWYNRVIKKQRELIYDN